MAYITATTAVHLAASLGPMSPQQPNSSPPASVGRQRVRVRSLGQAPAGAHVVGAWQISQAQMVNDSKHSPFHLLQAARENTFRSDSFPLKPKKENNKKS